MRTLQEIQPGQTLGRYEFLVPIAEGGMASVWAARLKGTRGFSKTVAVKTMLPSVSDNPEFEQMFLDEASIASRIRHPNVVEIMDSGEQEEVLYLVMEWVDGEPLSNLRRAAAKSGGIPRPIAVRIVADACAGLHAAHELKDENGHLVGLVHRDISPQNILITFDGVVKIVDFGVAKAAGRSTGQTTAGQVKGKPPYMSPEQALGEQVDRRTDVFALGIILYQLTTGKHPFRGESDLVTLQNIVSDKAIVPPRAYDKTYPRHLEAVVMKALDRRKEHRFKSCAEFEGALDEVFAKEIQRARTEDVGNCMKEALGRRGEERRKALVDGVRQADERAQGRVSVGDVSVVSRPVPSSSLTPASGTTSSVDLRITHSDDLGSAPLTPLAQVMPTEERGRRGAGIAAVIAVVLVGAVGGVAVSRSRGADERATAAVAAQPPAAETTKAPSPPVEKAEPPHAAVPETAPAPSVAKGVKRVPHVRPLPQPKPVAAALKPVTTPKPVPKGGFVPPPMSDPGF